MKNLLNKVLVVLTVSAVFAGSIGATPPKKSGAKASNTTAEPMSRSEKNRAAIADVEAAAAKMEFLTFVEFACSKPFAQVSEKMRKDRMVEEYGSLEKTPKSIQLCLLGSDTDKTVSFREGHKAAALKEAGNKSTKELAKELQEDAKALKANPEDPTLQEKVEAKKGLLESMTATMNEYLSPNTILAAQAAIGAAAVGLAVYASSYAIDYVASKAGYEGGYGQAFRTSVGTNLGKAGTYIGESRVGQAVGSAGSAIARKYRSMRGIETPPTE